MTCTANKVGSYKRIIQLQSISWVKDTAKLEELATLSDCVKIAMNSLFSAAKFDGRWEEDDEMDVGTAVFVPTEVLFGYRVTVGLALAMWGFHNLTHEHREEFLHTLHWSTFTPLLVGLSLFVLSINSHYAARGRSPPRLLARLGEASWLGTGALAFAAPIVRPTTWFAITPLVAVLGDTILTARIRPQLTHAIVPLLLALPATLWDASWGWRPQIAVDLAVVFGATIVLLLLSRVTDCASSEDHYQSIL